MTTTFFIEQGDVVIGTGGQPKTIADGLKFFQDLRESGSTEAKVNNIGAGLQDVIDGEPGDVFTIRAKVTRRLRGAIQRMQILQARHHRSERPPQERIRTLASVRVFALQGSLSAYAFRAEVVTAAGGRVPLTGEIS